MNRCDNLILHCIDFRIQDAVDEWIRNRGIVGNVDRVAIVGSCQSRQEAMRNAGVASRLHGVTHLILTQHQDCGAYGGREAFCSTEAEREKLIEDMRLLAAAARRSFPDIRVTMLFIQEVGDEWQFVEI